MPLPTRALLDNELNDLNQSVLSLSSMVDEAIGAAVTALLTSDVPLAESIMAGDADINRLRFQIEEKAYVILSTQQPLARDLRTVIAAIHFAIELERIGDHAAGIARVVQRIGSLSHPVVFEADGLPAQDGQARPRHAPPRHRSLHRARHRESERHRQAGSQDR
ncbi:MAG: hypothetical protein DCC51_14875 [Anaerolineae bacterium]|nr:MAG: hypothetical protein DCC51_14875 [Anaerolineae bacterium]